MRSFHDLDSIERKLLVELQEDASLSHAELSERVGASTASVWRRIKALETDGFLTKTVRLVDPERVGCGVNVICHIRIRRHAKEERDAFQRFVQSRPEIVACFSMSGEFDYLLRVVVPDIAAYNTFLMSQLLGHPSVAGASSHFALELVKHTTAVPI